MVEHNCGERGKSSGCSVWARWKVQFSNPLAYGFDPSKARVAPELAGMKVSSSFGGNLIIQGNPPPRTTYQVILDASLTDIYGQTLGEPSTLNFGTGPMPLSLSVPGDSMVVLDPAGQKRIPIYSVNQWIQSTEMALEAFADRTQLLSWATSLKDGKPIAGVHLELLEETPGGKTVAGATSRTGADPLAQTALPSDGMRKVLVARHVFNETAGADL